MIAMGVQELFDRNEKKLELIQHSSDGLYEGEYFPVIQQMAAWFNSIPLSLDIYEEPGGAFRCMIESIYFTLRQAKNAIFTSSMTSEKRREFEIQYKHAAFIAAVASWVDEPFRYYDFSLNDTLYNPTTHNGISSFVSGTSEFTIRLKDTVLPINSRRTVLMASPLILPSIEKLHPSVQDALYAAINTDRRPQNSESVLQNVVRKGLMQAEELERSSKKLLIVPASRSVSSAEMMKRNDESISSSDPENTSNTNQDVVTKNVASTEPSTGSVSKNTVGNGAPKTPAESKQISLPLQQVELPNIPKQWSELFAAMAEDIRIGKKKKEETEWLESGLLVPKNFFGGYGKSVQVCIETLRNLELIVCTHNKGAVIVSSIGELLVPRP